jgi:hypothetical protein
MPSLSLRPVIFAPSNFASASMSVPGFSFTSSSFATRFGGALVAPTGRVAFSTARGENVKEIRAVGLRHKRKIQIAQQHPQSVVRRQILKLGGRIARRAFTHAWLSRYQRIVSRMPSSNLCAGVHPSSRWIFVASMA